MCRRAARTSVRLLLLVLTLTPIALTEDEYDQHPCAVVHRVQPVYPEIARRLSLEGLVMLRAEVSADGHVKSVAVVSGNAILAQAAVRAVREWVFAPGAQEVVPVGVTFNRKQ
jgi:TonB family protein